MTSPMLEVAVSTSGTSLVTSTVVAAAPASSFRLISSTCDTSRVISAATVLKPVSFTSTWYLPALSALKVYSPEPLVCAVTVLPVPVFVTATVAFGTTAPVESEMVPMRRAVSVCASTKPARQNTEIRTRKGLLGMFPPIRRCHQGHPRGHREFGTARCEKLQVLVQIDPRWRFH